MKTLYGMVVIISPDHPKMQLSADCPVTPEFRVEMNLWMREFFGTTNLVPDGRSIVLTQQNRVVVNPRTYAQLVEATREYTFDRNYHYGSLFP